MSDDVDIEVPEKDHSGDVEKFKIQTGSRVKIPQEWLNYLGLEVGDDIIVACEDDGILVKEWTRENLQEL